MVLLFGRYRLDNLLSKSCFSLDHVGVGGNHGNGPTAGASETRCRCSSYERNTRPAESAASPEETAQNTVLIACKYKGHLVNAQKTTARKLKNLVCFSVVSISREGTANLHWNVLLEKNADFTTAKVWSTTYLDIPYPAKCRMSERPTFFCGITVHNLCGTVRNVGTESPLRRLRASSVPNFAYISLVKQARKFQNISVGFGSFPEVSDKNAWRIDVPLVYVDLSASKCSACFSFFPVVVFFHTLLNRYKEGALWLDIYKRKSFAELQTILVCDTK